MVGACTLMMVMKRLSLIGRRSFISLPFTPVGRLGICFRSLDLMAIPALCILSSRIALPYQKCSHCLILSATLPQPVEFH